MKAKFKLPTKQIKALYGIAGNTSVQPNNTTGDPTTTISVTTTHLLQR